MDGEEVIVPTRDQSLAYLSDLLSPDEIRQELDTKVFGKRDIVYFRETDSTNTRAKDLAAGDAPEGTLIVSEKQEKGRGRKGRGWFSPPQQGIYASLILRPTISPREAPRITLLTAVAVAETLLSLTGLKVNIKWPNDILVNGRKIAGILTEISAHTDAIDYIVVGLGLNVNTPRFPDDIRDKATSILIETGKQFPRIRLIREYLRRLERYYEVFKGIGFEPVMKRWKQLTNIVGQEIMVEVTGKKYIGEVKDVDRDGALILKDTNGKSHRISSGDVTLM
ncbi:MAG: biotin--[acetyl-CoA-carboxylase] ligase [Deltaproteobacteria bacterium]|nr:MAG: biotin--[acetyl-CoA-carboxylase] ligase [Deltaproteobacteria bacterium]